MEIDLNKKDKEQKTREFGLSSLSVTNSTSVFILAAIIVVAGLMSYISMPKEQFPEIVLPTVYINTVYPGNSPVDIENLITRPIEKELKSIKGVKKITSTSAQDVSVVIIEFNEDVNISKALTDVKDAVDKAKGELPSDLDNDPTILEMDFTEIPVMEINLSGDFEIDKLKDYAEQLEDEIEALSEVSRVEINGALDREIQVNCDVYKMQARKVTFGDIEKAIANENITMSGGDIVSKGFRRSLRIFGEFTTVKEIEDIIIKNEDLDIVYLRDVAKVEDSYVERKSFARLATDKFLEEGSFPVVSLKVIKKGGENLIIADEEIREILDDAKATYLPNNLSIVLTNNQADSMKLSISNLENSIISGVILVVIVLLFFMGLRNALFVGIAIPLSMFMSFMILSAFGITINIVVLFGLILALGMLVDNAIVVIENIYRLMEQGYPPLKAAKEGVGEVAVAIISSTATTLAAFVPLAFWGGIMGEFMKYLPITLIVVLASSLFVGLVINPVVAKALMKVEDKTKKNYKWALIFAAVLVLFSIKGYIDGPSYAMPNLLVTLAGITVTNNIFVLKPVSHWFQDVLLVKLEQIYIVALRFALSSWRPIVFFFGTIVTLVVSIGMFASNVPQVALFPSSDPLYAYLYIETPLGTDVKVTDAVAKELEKKAFEVLEPYKHVVKSIVTNVGEGTGDPMEGPQTEITPHKAKISVGFVDFQDRQGASSKDVLKELSKLSKSMPGVTIRTDKNKEGPPVGKPINIEVTGEDYITLIAEAEKIKKLIDQAKIAGVDGLKMEVEVGKPELLLGIDRAKVRRFGLSTGMIAAELRTAIYGKEVSKFKDGEDEYPIQVRLDESVRYNPSRLANLTITFRDQMGKWHQVPISAVTNTDYSTTFGSVKRKDLDRMIAVSSNVTEGYNANEIVAEIKALLAKHDMPPGYEFKFTGEQEEQAKSMAFLARAMMLAVAAIFLILVSQFNSAIKPFIIVASVLFSTIGVFLGLTIFNDDFIIIMTGIGIISLAGIVVNNAIVLIDYIELTRVRMKEELGIPPEERLPNDKFIECLVQGGYTRLRPVLLTAITTVLGLVPLATGLNIDFIGFYATFNPDIYVGGENASFWGPMAWTVIYGLVFATFLTLIVVPVMFLLSEQILAGMSKLKQKLSSM